MTDLTELRNSYDVRAAFKLNDNPVVDGELEEGEKALERIKLVLNQTFDALKSRPFRQIEVNGKVEKVLIFYYQEEIIGVICDRNLDSEKIRRFIYESTKEEVPVDEETEEDIEVEEEEIEEREEVEVSEEETKEDEEEEIEEREEVEDEEEIEGEIEEEIEEVKIEKEYLKPDILDSIKEIAGEYLGDFSLDIISNIIEDSEVDDDNPTKDSILELISELENAASLIIGPSKSEKLKNDILNKIEEEG